MKAATRKPCVLITGASGFIGQNLLLQLQEFGHYRILTFGREDDEKKLFDCLMHTDVVVHLAGENRPLSASQFDKGNRQLTSQLASYVEQVFQKTGRLTPIIFASSNKSFDKTPYGLSKKFAEEALEKLTNKTGNPLSIYRLPGVFGKWCKPNYNSVVATFCNNIARGLPIKVSDAKLVIPLVYIDDVVADFVATIQHFLHSHSGVTKKISYDCVAPEYKISLGELANKIQSFKSSRRSLFINRVGEGFDRALYSTYLSYLQPENFVYELPGHKDHRGSFFEFVKTPDCGQISFFTISPGSTRGAHYHHTKTEKFMVVYGAVKMKFKHIISGKEFEIELDSDFPRVVDTVPGWVHNIINAGTKDAVVMLWANELFDPNRKDTFHHEI